MGDTYPKIRIAAVQAAPVFLNREGTVEKACSLIRQAGTHGAKVIGFSEGFIPGHPLWYHFHPATSAHSMKLATELFKNSVEIPSAATEALCKAAQDVDAYVVMGLCERRPGTFGTLYNTQLFLSDEGKIIGKHQKLMPTVGERMVHTGGYGDTLRAYPTRYGKISGLICGENSNPLAVFALVAEGTMIHVASWPNSGHLKQFSRSDRAGSVGRAVAMMSKAYVMNVSGPVNEEMAHLLAANDEDLTFLRDPRNSGGSSIIDPRSVIIAGPMGGEEGILYADIDLELCVREKITHDFAGHYNRADVFSLSVNRDVPSLYRPYERRISGRGGGTSPGMEEGSGGRSPEADQRPWTSPCGKEDTEDKTEG